jgi:hypothetical protein
MLSVLPYPTLSVFELLNRSVTYQSLCINVYSFIIVGKNVTAATNTDEIIVRIVFYESRAELQKISN